MWQTIWTAIALATERNTLGGKLSIGAPLGPPIPSYIHQLVGEGKAHGKQGSESSVKHQANIPDKSKCCWKEMEIGTGLVVQFIISYPSLNPKTHDPTMANMARYTQGKMVAHISGVKSRHLIRHEAHSIGGNLCLAL